MQASTHLWALMAAMVSTLLPGAALVLASGTGLSAGNALPPPPSSPAVMLAGRICAAQLPEPGCDSSGMLLLSEGAVLLLIDTKDASDLRIAHHST